MDVGILTYHVQPNYGAVLQCWALQQVLAKCVREVSKVNVLDLWWDDKCKSLTGGYPRMLCGRAGIRLFFRCVLGLGDASRRRRYIRTKKFVRGKLALTPYHFLSWRDFERACSEAGCKPPDCLVVGSDQVWNVGPWSDPSACLLRGAPSVFRAISYAASFGLTSIPDDWREVYRQGLGRFEQISCRESEGVRLCRELGFDAEHVVDPTLLLEPEHWMKFAGVSDLADHKKGRKRLACYFIAEDLDAVLPTLEDYAHREKCRIDLFADGVPPSWYIAMPFSWRDVCGWVKKLWRRLFSPVRVRVDAGPLEFVQAISRSDSVITDSFHGFMFSIIFKRNVRVLRPSSARRLAMFSRIEEFVPHSTGPLVVEGLPAALNSLTIGPRVTFDESWIHRRRAESLHWLRQALNGKF